MSASSNKILSVYNSRNTLVEILTEKGYKTDDYSNFSINEVDAMYKNTQLDMLLTHSKNSRKGKKRKTFNKLKKSIRKKK